jgi:hypothetical protein
MRVKTTVLMMLNYAISETAKTKNLCLSFTCSLFILIYFLSVSDKRTGFRLFTSGMSERKGKNLFSLINTFYVL